MREFSHEFADHWFHTPTPLEKAGGFYLIRAGRNIAKSNYRMGPRFIAYFSLHFVLSGTVLLNDDTILEQGDVFCLWPQVTHQYRIANRLSTQSDEPLKMFWIALNGRQILSLMQMIGITQTRPCLMRVISREVRHTIEDICMTLDTITTRTAENESLQLISRIYELFYGLSAHADSSHDAKEWIENVLEYINLHYREGVSVQDLVQLSGLNRSHFTRAFTARTGVNPNELLETLRMMEAVKMLKNPAHSITEIGLSLGFLDLYSFSRSFSRFYGMSPSQYRRTILEEKPAPDTYRNMPQ